MAKNENLHKAKSAKNDEFYTQLVDVEKELQHYTEHFKDKSVLCNCNDSENSAFYQYFFAHFDELGLKKLVCTSYNKEGVGCKLVHEGGNSTIIPLEGNGDFRSHECIELLKEEDIVVTNPPFSLFKEYLDTLIKYHKKFIIIGNLNAISYKNTFHYLKTNQMWLGYNGNCSMTFRKLFTYELRGSAFIGEDGSNYVSLGSCTWYTNLDIMKRHKNILLCKQYNPTEYPKYDNYDAINVKRTSEIPCDYFEEMSVPISFMNHYNPNQFEIIGLLIDYKGEDFIQGTPIYTDEKHKNSTCAVLNGKRQYAKILIRRKDTSTD